MKIVSSLSAGTIATLLEVFALLVGLLIAANLQAIVTLTARRRLFTRGSARLRDSTWNVGIVEGILNPRRLREDWRVLVAFVLALFVILLEALTVLQTQAAETCTHSTTSTWNIRRTDQKCFKLTGGTYASDAFVSDARKKAADVDLDYGIPIHTNVFEKSIVNGEAVRQLSEHEDRLLAPIESVFDTAAEIKTVGDRRVDYFPQSDKENNFNLCGGLAEARGFIPMELEVLRAVNGSMVDIRSSGFVETAGCQGIMTVRVCPYGKRLVFKNLPDPERTEIDLNVTCRVYRIEREGRKALPEIVANELRGANKYSEATIRRAVFVSLIALNSAGTQACKRYIAAPKPCTEIGWVSLAAVLILFGLLIVTSLIRIGLSLSSRDSVDYNGSEEDMARSIFEHFVGARKRSHDFITPGKHQTLRQRLKKMINGPSRDEDDFFVSVVKSDRKPDAFHLSWTREPVGPDATAIHVPSNSVIPIIAESKEEVEVSLM